MNNEDRVELEAFLETTSNLKAELSTTADIGGNISAGVTKVSTNDHTLLKNRDLPNQHPISAITNLEEELMSIKQTATNNYNDLSMKINNKIRTVTEIPSDMNVGDYIFLEIKEEE